MTCNNRILFLLFVTYKVVCLIKTNSNLIMSKDYKILYWTPRIIYIIAILFVSLFALDAFDPKLTIWEQIGGFLIHLIPSFILLGLLFVAWKYELIGGIILIVLGLIFSIIVFRHNYGMNQSFWMSLGVIAAITFPFIIAGVLFVIHHLKSRKTN